LSGTALAASADGKDAGASPPSFQPTDPPAAGTTVPEAPATASGTANGDMPAPAGEALLTSPAATGQGGASDQGSDLSSPAATTAPDSQADHSAPAAGRRETVRASAGAAGAAPVPIPDSAFATAATPGAAIAASAATGDAGPTTPGAAAPRSSSGQTTRRAASERLDAGQHAPAATAAVTAAFDPASGIAASADMPAASAPVVASQDNPAATGASSAAAPLDGTAGTAATSAATSTATPGGLSPAQQALPALVSLGRGLGTQHVTVRLDPLELGKLQIRIEQSQDGPARVTLTAERPETLDLLVRDQAQLHRALDQAGVPADGRSLTFHLAAADPPATTARATSTTPDAGSAMGDGGTGADRGPQRNASPSRHQPIAGGSAGDGNDIPTTARWLRAGIDITA
jgi:hypothetical protein